MTDPHERATITQRIESALFHLRQTDVDRYLEWERGDVVSYDPMYHAKGRAHDRVSDILSDLTAVFGVAVKLEK